MIEKYSDLSRSTLVLGPGGSGKTTIAKWLDSGFDLDAIGGRESVSLQDTAKQEWVVRPDLILMVERLSHHEYYLGQCSNVKTGLNTYTFSHKGVQGMKTHYRPALVHLPWRQIICLLYRSVDREDGLTQYDFRFGPKSGRVNESGKDPAEYEEVKSSIIGYAQWLDSLGMQTVRATEEPRGIHSPICIIDCTDVQSPEQVARTIQAIQAEEPSFVWNDYVNSATRVILEEASIHKVQLPIWNGQSGQKLQAADVVSHFARK